MKNLPYLLVLLLILGVLYAVDIIKMPTNVKQVTELDIPLIDPCFNKNTSGNYTLSILFEESQQPAYALQKMEIYYSIQLKKDRCFVTGTGAKQGYTMLDTLTGKRGNFRPDSREVIVNGECARDSLFLNVFFKTSSNRDCKVKAAFPFFGNNISVLNGIFYEECGNSRGLAKLIKN